MTASAEVDDPLLSYQEFMEKLRRLTITAKSPDQTVRVTYGYSGSRVELGSRGTRGHTEETLSRQISAALEASQHGYQRAIALLFEQVTGERPPAKEPDKDSPAAVYRDSLDAIAIETVSPRGLVKVGRSGVTGIRLIIRPRTLSLGTVPDEELMAEVNAAVRGAEEEYTRKFEVAKANSLRKDV
ncbi:hypothetical protein Afil01_02250 [Actinorhabdospora filicis]|uniref:YbaB/EbfC DNA-binding family protein n=1 Tax=Actinorhabdospora filicis TaxID=1785913 RepID=A0A9W6SG68_9ACTN|nr:hypothetical protein [Actinorhabdospora filicis]GLZ75418.1 hypothetical protein Afil01_02250 [Actinorhabdospora filicis]